MLDPPHSMPLFRGFEGSLVYRPDIIPVCLDFRRLIMEADRKPEQILGLSPRQFEELIAEIWHRMGYEIELTAQTRDGGRDIIAVRRSEAQLRFLIECKRYDPKRKVGVELVRALHGVKVHEKATKGILATTSRFTKDAKSYFAEHIWELEPRDYDGIVEWVRIAVKEPPNYVLDC